MAETHNAPLSEHINSLIQFDFLAKCCDVEIREESEDVDWEDALEVCRKGENPREADGVMNEGAMLVEWMRCIARARTSDAVDTLPPTTPAEEHSHYYTPSTPTPPVGTLHISAV
ncbi:hypothetical protein E2C01_017487 [Portunus trituberculatus]|uniref:Uncharacterized protein n=1 Tax=Portunus trituberculatus TaxID=210409 RepID=A0A5B7DTY6_PORTR|nr:hypothetical protein [Portunus trituberculatus]